MTPHPRADEHLPLHPESFRILLAVGARPLHGYAIVKEMERDPDRPGRVLPANLYRRMRTLRDQGLISETEGPDSDDDERRRYFERTPLGDAVVTAETHRLRGLLAEAEQLSRG